MKTANKDAFFEWLKKMFPEPIIELHYTTPFQLLIAVIMSAQATDKQVNKVTTNLFKAIIWPWDVVSMWQEKFTEAIKSIGLYKSKWKNVFNTSVLLTNVWFINQRKNKVSHPKAHDIFEQYGYYIPDTISWLETLHGVGEKTAKVVASNLYDLPVVAVDTHVHRVANRIGLTNTSTPLQTSKVIEKKIGKKYIKTAHHAMILFGRYHCLARKPQCDSCPFSSFCNYYHNNSTK